MKDLFYDHPGYTGLYKRRTGSYSDGCAVFYRESKLKLLEWKGLEYQCRVTVLNRDNVAVLAKFAVVENGCVTCTVHNYNVHCI